MTTDPTVIRAPWTPEQVARLNDFQYHGGMHPFTCGGDHTPGRPLLVAHPDGWHCSDPYSEGCEYRQDWAHAFMAEPRTCSGNDDFCGIHGYHRCKPGALPPIRTGTPAYDAVYAYFQDLGEAMPPDPVHRNAMIWRGVQAAVEAMQATYTPPPPGSDRDALPEHLRGLIWPHMRPYLSTACETAEACRLAGEAHRDHADELRAWETREHAACRVTRKQDMASCDCRCHTTPKETP